jgi:LuxR family maltose regulon positive regulatory protein
MDPTHHEVAESVSGAPSGHVDHQGRYARKLHPDTARAGVVPRTKLVERLCAAEEARVVVVAAPAGYGKSTLLAQWLERDSRSGAWLTLDHHDNDPATLLTNVARSLGQAGLLSGDAQSEFRFTSATALSRGVWTLVRSIDEATSGLLVLDQADSLRSRASRDVVAELAVRIPPTMTLAVASRSDIRLPAAKLRSRGELLEVSASDLAMSGEEAEVLAAHLGINGHESVIDALVEHTEGWPVGLYLTMLTAKSDDPSPTSLQVRGDDRFLAEYMRGELFGRLSEKRASLLVRISILDEFSGPLCDFLLEREDSSRTLDSLASANLLIVPLDHRRRWYRFHQLFREFLLGELQRREPEAVDSLHLRAAMWYEDHDIPDEAIRHAMAAGDQDRVARLVAASARVTFAEGRADTVLDWLAWFGEADRSARYPDICVLALLAHAHLGDAVLAQRYAATIGAAGERPADLSPVARLARALMCGAGIERMHADAVEAQASLPPASEWHAAAVAAEGLALLWSGETEAADARLALAAEIGERFSAVPAAIFALATRSAIATKRGDHAEADALATRSLHLVRRVGLERYATSVVSFVVAARAARHRGDPAEARRLLSQASTLRPILTVVLPVIAIQSLLEMAEVEIELGDIAGARQLLREVADILNQRSGLGRLEDRFLEMRERLSSMPAGATTASTLTNAELRLLPLLVTHLSFPEIGERLYLSRHTVKTQAMSIYRKLGVSSRSEAVSAAREMHLLDI